jgi:hypothetical protein
MGERKRRGQRYVYLLAVVGAMGGLLWGYDTGVTAGALGSLTKTFHLSSFTRSWPSPRC